MRCSAVVAGEMGMALCIGAVVGQFEMPCSFSQEGLVDDTGMDEGFERSIDGDFVGCGGTEFFCYVGRC